MKLDKTLNKRATGIWTGSSQVNGKSVMEFGAGAKTRRSRMGIQNSLHSLIPYFGALGNYVKWSSATLVCL
jgi:hypothetical protein